MSDTTTITEGQEQEATVTPITDAPSASAAAEAAPVKATWKAHGRPVSGFDFYGTTAKAPNAKPIKVAKVETADDGTITFKTRAGRAIDGGSFKPATRFWAVVPADAPRREEEPKAPRTERTVAEGRTSAADRLAAATSGDSAHAAPPAGYDIRWPKPAFDLLKRNDTAPEGSPAWLVRCNAHGTTTAAADTKAGDKLGTRAERPNWCPGCKADAQPATTPAKASK
jgi:hypothetical protein